MWVVLRENECRVVMLFEEREVEVWGSCQRPRVVVWCTESRAQKNRMRRGIGSNRVLTVTRSCKKNVVVELLYAFVVCAAAAAPGKAKRERKGGGVVGCTSLRTERP